MVRAMKKLAIVLTSLVLGTSAAMACPMEGHGTQSAENKDKPKAADKTADKTSDKAKTDKPAEKPADKAPAAPAKKPA